MSDTKTLAVRLNHLPLWLLRRIQAAERQCRANPEHEPSQVCNSWQAAMWLESWVSQHVNDSNWLDHWGSSEPTTDSGGERLFVTEPYASDRTIPAVKALADILGLHWRQAPESDWGYGTTRFEFWKGRKEHEHL